MDVFGRGAVRELKVVRVEVVLQVLAVNDGDQRGIQRAKRTASKTEPSGEFHRIVLDVVNRHCLEPIAQI